MVSEIKNHNKINKEQFSSTETNIVDFIQHTEESNTIKIHTIRELQDKIKYGPLHQSKLFIMINNIEKLGKEAANAFLKTLEEPPENTCFFLLSHNLYALPKTIISSCSQLFINKSHSTTNTPNEFISFTQIIKHSLFDKLSLSQQFIDKKILINELIYAWLEEISSHSNKQYYKYIPLLLKTLENTTYNVNKRLQIDVLLSSIE